jgi:hypothetical protein
VTVHHRDTESTEASPRSGNVANSPYCPPGGNELAGGEYLTREKKYLARHRQYLVHEKNYLVHEKTDLTREKNDLVHEKNDLAREKKYLAGEKKYLMHEKTDLVRAKRYLGERRVILVLSDLRRSLCGLCVSVVNRSPSCLPGQRDRSPQRYREHRGFAAIGNVANSPYGTPDTLSAASRSI